MMLVFSQKTGAGLFLHNLLHTDTAAQSGSSRPDEKGREFSYACSCIDDFMMPMATSDQPELVAPVAAPVSRVIVYRESIPFVSLSYSSLRGPPAGML